MTAVIETSPLAYRVLLDHSNTDEWLGLRKCGVGASESPAILGDSAWGTPRTVYDQKIDDKVSDFTTDLMEFGHLAEDLMVKFMLSHPERFGWMGEILPAEGLLQSIAWPWLLGTLDRLIFTPSGILVPLELKSVNDFIASEWRVGEDDEEFGFAQYVVPKKYQVQVQQQMAVTDAPFAYVAVWLGKGQLVVIRVDRDEAYIQEFLVGKIGDFWHFHVETRTPPPATLNDDLWKIWPGDLSLEPIEADDLDKALILEWRQVTSNMRDEKKTVKQLKFEITDRMGNATEIIDPETREVLHTLRPQNTARGTDFIMLEAKYPEAYDECVKPAGRTRVHRATKVSIE